METQSIINSDTLGDDGKAVANMTDFISKEARSALMSRIRSKNTGIERTVFKLLRSRGLKFRRHCADLPGCPDVAFPEQQIAVFLDGDFWHGRSFSRWRRRLKNYWRNKIEKNIRRDRLSRRKLRRRGWRVVRIWGKSIEAAPYRCLASILSVLSSAQKPKRLVYRTARRPLPARDKRHATRLHGPAAKNK